MGDLYLYTKAVHDTIYNLRTCHMTDVTAVQDFYSKKIYLGATLIYLYKAPSPYFYTDT